uniref:Uncharacterized protein n=1 Tax=Arion vulgaris TaxID=1028688 RepID=A0A0B7BV23_9EUPU
MQLHRGNPSHGLDEHTKPNAKEVMRSLGLLPRFCATLSADCMLFLLTGTEPYSKAWYNEVNSLPLD